jgi:hypothetical protein
MKYILVVVNMVEKMEMVVEMDSIDNLFHLNILKNKIWDQYHMMVMVVVVVVVCMVAPKMGLENNE